MARCGSDLRDFVDARGVGRGIGAQVTAGELRLLLTTEQVQGRRRGLRSGIGGDCG